MMDKILSYKRFAGNLVVANIVITCVWIILSLSLIKTLKENDNQFLIWTLLVITAADVVSAYFGISGVVRRNGCQLTTYYILSQISIVGECFICLLILLTSRSNVGHPVTNSVHSGVAISVLITQIWLLFETKSFQNLAEIIDFGCYEEFRDRRMSSPPNICNIEKNSHVFTLTDQLLFCPVVETKDSLNNNCFGSPSRSFASEVYCPSTTPIGDQKDHSLSTQWYYTPRTTFPEYVNNSSAKY